jgi:hypothetical protein
MLYEIMGMDDLPISFLVRVLGDSDYWIRHLALETCRKMGISVAKITSLSRAKNWDVRCAAMSLSIGRNDVPAEVIICRLRDEEGPVRVQALMACKGRENDIPANSNQYLGIT